MKLKQQILTMTTAHQAFAEVDAAVAAGDQAVDLSGITHADSSMVALLLHAHRTLAAKGKTLQVLHAPSSLERLLAVYGIESLLQGTLN
jgi:ABC-type transporter Mla MlaB component